MATGAGPCRGAPDSPRRRVSWAAPARRAAHRRPQPDPPGRSHGADNSGNSPLDAGHLDAANRRRPARRARGQRRGVARLKNGRGRRTGGPTERATSCGGIIVRQLDDGPEIVLGRRTGKVTESPGACPRGRPTKRDDRADGAARGDRGNRPGGTHLAPVGPIEYFFTQRGTRIHKTVHYFLMEVTGGGMANHDHEFDEVALDAHRRGTRSHDLSDRARDRRAGPRRADAQTPDVQQTALIERASRRRRPTDRLRRLGDARPVRGHPRGASGGARARRPVRPVAHGRGLGNRARRGRGPGLRAGDDPPRLADGRAHYSHDLRRRRRHHRRPDRLPLADERFLVVPNASNREAVAAALRERLAGYDAALDDASLRTSLVAVQGPGGGACWRR